jgi:hypothetical protein
MLPRDREAADIGASRGIASIDEVRISPSPAAAGEGVGPKPIAI